MSTKHRNAGGPFLVFDPGLGISGSLSVDGTVQGTNDGLQINSDLHVTGTLSTSAGLSGDLTGNVTGNADTATTATTATNVTVTDNQGNNETVYIAFVDGSSGGQGIEVDSTGLRYNPSLDTLYVDNVNGNLFTGNVVGNVTGDVTGNADTATTAGTVTTAAQANITSVGTLTGLTVSGDIQLPSDNTQIQKLDMDNNTVFLQCTAGNNDVEVLRVSNDGEALNSFGIGYSLVYSGSGSGNNNTFQLMADNQRNGPRVPVWTAYNNGNFQIGDSGAQVTTILDEDAMGSDSATALATQQSIKAYVDANAGSFTYLQENTSNADESKILIANKDGTFPADNVKTAALVIKSGDNSTSGGYATAAIAIHRENNNTGWQIAILHGAGGTYRLHFSPDEFNNSYVMSETIGSGHVFISTSFTGQHRSLPSSSGSLNSYNDKIGFIVESTGEYQNFESDSVVYKPSINQAIPKIRLSETRNSKKVFGVVSEIEGEKREINEPMGVIMSIPDSDRRVLVNSIGEGGIWICNINGNLENGDYITSCEIPGLGMKQDDDLLHNYTVAKITCDCNFDLESSIYDCEEFEFNGSTYRKAFVGCTYHCG